MGLIHQQVRRRAFVYPQTTNIMSHETTNTKANAKSVKTEAGRKKYGRQRRIGHCFVTINVMGNSYWKSILNC